MTPGESLTRAAPMLAAIPPDLAAATAPDQGGGGSPDRFANRAILAVVYLGQDAYRLVHDGKSYRSPRRVAGSTGAGGKQPDTDTDRSWPAVLDA